MNEILSRRNEIVRHLKRLGADRKYRDSFGEMLCDGKKLLFEALGHGYEVTSVLWTGDKPDIEISGMYRTSRDIIEYVSPLKTAQNIVFSCKIREKTKRLMGNSIILENIQDPGNVGAMLRTANAFGVDCVYLLGTCADMYNPKTIRASMGAAFRQDFGNIDYGDIDKMKKMGIPVYGAALAEDCVSLESVSLSGCSFVIGNEGHGITEELLLNCDKKVIIPINPDCESLNASSAAAVIMWEMRKAR